MDKADDYKEVSDVAFCLHRIVRARSYLAQQNYYELLAFLEQNPNEKPSARSRRMTAANQFSQYLVRNGYEAYIIPRKVFPTYDGSF